ncbi:insulinase family protein [Ruminiclostridium herbifermentans]|uniref:Insulinase family protein n=1 Tax=Ruminiclostridium herbifermentans TaxID=2488810 RepID=A0A4U7JDX9_9FIRM|nr:pitrilysin family protein [Ruminiclostridium herbifermentans]QNU65725.1 insulinase family protein [Ruminiclostridium herbifermentans]
MTNTYDSEDKLNKIIEINGIRVFNIKTNKFKTNTINVFFQDDLNVNSVSLNALFPSVLRRGCKGLPTIKEINLYLEDLYGAIFDCGIAKKGERQIMQFYFEYLSDKYTFNSSSNFEKAFEFLINIIFNPVLQDGTFNEQYVELEKSNLKMLVEGRTNDKVQYAQERCHELMCKDEPFGLYEYGSIDQIERITSDELYKHYKEKVSTLPIDIFVTGELNDKDIDLMKGRLKSIKRTAQKALSTSIVKKFVDKVSYFEDKMDVNQGKLSLGFRTNITAKEDDYYSLLVYNGILGGGMHSKLFQNVREKAGLAYFVFASLEKFKGLMVIESGIDIKEKDHAKELILKQLEDIQAGKISDYELNATIKAIETGILSLKDSQLQIVDFYLSQLIAGTHDTMENVIEKTKNVSKQDVVNVSKKILLDTVYFLTAK